MEEILVFGHKSPDTDSVTSAIVMAEFEKKMGKNVVRPCVLGNLNKETEYVFDYLKIEKPELIESVEEGKKIILVDHNEAKQSVDNREKANILKIIDHHSIDFKTSNPIYYRAEPVGCTATILYKMYKENGIEIEKNIAILMISAIISDTLLFKSPTCTDEDIKAANELNKIADLNLEEYGLLMLKAGTDLSCYTADELVLLDAKEFEIGNIKTIVAQVNTASIEDTLKREAEIKMAIQKQVEDKKLDLFMFVITDIINSNSETIAFGNRTDLIEKSYNVKLKDNRALLKGIVSRKKQIIPILTENV